MRVAMIDPSLFTLPYDRMLAKGLEEGGHSVALYARRPGPEDGEAEGVHIVPAFYPVAGSPVGARLPGPLRLAVKGLDHVISMARLRRRLVRPERPDVLHFMWLPLPLVDRGFLAGLRTVAPMVLTVHDTNPFNGNASAELQRFGTHRCFGAFDRLIVHTRQGRERLLAQGVAGERITLLPHGPLGTAPPAATAADPMLGPLTFVLFGKMKPHKGADLLIAAFARLPEALRGAARVRVIGKPYIDLAPLRALVQEHGVADAVSLEPRFVAEAEIPDVYGPGTVAVFPYREIEASGVLTLALACGRPMIASRIGTFAEWLEDGTHGLLVPPLDVDSLSAAMAHMLRERDFAARCLHNVRRLAAALPGWQQIARETAVTYEAVQCRGIG